MLGVGNVPARILWLLMEATLISHDVPIVLEGSSILISFDVSFVESRVFRFLGCFVFGLNSYYRAVASYSLLPVATK